MEVITNSARATMMDCPMKYKLRYEDCLVLRFEKPALSLGSAFHLGRQTRNIQDAIDYLSNIYPSTQEEIDELETNKVIVRAMLTGYFALYGMEQDKVEYEVKFSVPIINPKTGAKSKTFLLEGSIDAIDHNNGCWLQEDKTASQISRPQIDKLSLDNQITNYIYGGQRAYGLKFTGVKYRYSRKPSIKQRQSETLEQYLTRLEQDYLDRPEFYFVEEKVFRSQDDLATFERELWFFTQMLLKCRREGLWYKNPSHCLDYGSCSYMPLCCNKPGAMDLYQVSVPHPELEEGEANAA